MFAQDSIDLLKRSGINFEKLKTDGISPADFGELLVPSGLVLNPDIRWISFHSGYDFGYLLKLLTCVPLPAQEAKFFRLLHLWFPNVFDVKHMMTGVDSLKGGLNKLASDLGVRCVPSTFVRAVLCAQLMTSFVRLQVARVGPMHQAGSDSMLTSAVFFEMKRRFFGGADLKKWQGVLYGLGSSTSSSSR